MLLKENLYKIALVLIFTIGLAARLFLYLKNQSLWGDEAALASNILNNSYGELFKGLKLMQVAPAGFTILVKFTVDLFHPQTFFMRDLIMRFVPFTAGVLALPAFYYLANLIFANNKKLMLVSSALFVFNPCAIVYSAQLKQYSIEMLSAILLLIIFYKMVVLNKFKWHYPFIIAIFPWLSYSSFFIIASGFGALLFKNWKRSLIFAVPVILSSIVYYFVSLKLVFAVNYFGMNEYWNDSYAFMDFTHPLRFLFRIGEVFAMSKILALISGIVIVLAYFMCFISKKDIGRKVLFISPLLFVVLASMLHKYPLCARLILFLVPLFVILITEIKNDIAKIIIGIITIISVFSFTPDAQEAYYSYARDVVQYLQKNIKRADVIIIDSHFADYDSYFDKLDNKIIRLPVFCIAKNIEKCRVLIDELPQGNYYFLSLSYYVKEITENNGCKVQDLDLGFKPKKVKAVYFEK